MERTILLADDTALFLRIEQDALKGSPVKVLTASDGLQALELTRRSPPDVIVLDLHMPRMDGARCCSEIKADPNLRHIPVIIVTNAANNDDKQRCRDSGCDLLLHKPLPNRALLQALHAFIPEIDRRPPRVPFSGKVVLETGAGVVSGRGVDLCEHGIGAIFDSHPVDDIRRVTFYLDSQSEGIEADAVIVWTKKLDGGKTQAGLRLKGVTGPGLAFMRVHEIRAYVAARVEVKGEA